MKRPPLISLLFVLIVLCGLAAWYGCSRDGSDQKANPILIGGTDCRLRAKRTLPTKVIEEAESIVQRYERNLNDKGSESQIARINLAAGLRPVQVDGYIIEILKKSLNYARLSDGRYDPSAAPLYELWENWTGESRTVQRSRVHSVLEQVHFRRIRMSEGVRQVFIPDEGMRISMHPGMDGYIVDKTADLLQSRGVADVCIAKGIVRRAINGSTQYTFAEEILYENGKVQSGYVVTLHNLKARALATLYTSEHLLINLSSGFPVENGLICLVSTGPEAYAAEVLAFTVASGDLNSGLALVAELPFFEVLCITENREIFCTAGLEPHVDEIDSDYTLHVFDSRVEEDLKNEQVAYIRPVVSVGTADGKNILRRVPGRAQRD